MNGNNDRNAPTWSSLNGSLEDLGQTELEEVRLGEELEEFIVDEESEEFGVSEFLETTVDMEVIDVLRLDGTFDQDVFEVPFLQGLPQGLTSERIEKFEHFTADESLVGEQCLICMNDLEFGMEMVRLDCHVDHILCKVCVKKWFKNHKTCPTCRHAFK